MNPEKNALYGSPLDGEWKKSSFSNGSSEHCVELMPLANGGIAIRDSKTPDHPELRYTSAGFAAFLEGVKAGEFDRLL